MRKRKEVTIPAAYPYDGSAKPQVLKKGRAANNPQATKLSTTAEAVGGAILGGLTGHRNEAESKKHAVLRQKNPSAALTQDMKAAVKTTTDFFKMKSAPPIPGAKAKRRR